ncbi:lysozyme [Methylocystis heyeri]|uniref:Lysozyme n=1 Tax=Methylocystis heyeri TaxID=391905 RepID=A0A6B8KGM4_9HYPH|nr:lysozyme [Methylocystis heyeri]QGM46125.1 glycoside hydrolase family protein [Methylocystis heyeri]
MLSISPKGEAFIKSFEQCRLVAYADSGGVPTIGWGHTAKVGGPAVRVGQRITQEQADTLFNLDVARFERDVNKVVAMGVALAQHQFDALVSFHYNTGKLLSPKCSIVRLLKKGKHSMVPAVMLQYVNVNGKPLVGLKRRRLGEVGLWNMPDDGYDAPEPEYAGTGAIVDDVTGKGIFKSKIGNSAIGGAVLTGTDAANQWITDAGNTLTNFEATISSATLGNSSLGEILASAGGLVATTLSDPKALSLTVVALLCIAIWWWRYEHMEESLI